ncbi:hypothetical protein Tco_0290226 [Tanacetum coccineum]
MEDGIFFNQSKYIKEMLKKIGLKDSKPTKTLMSTEIKLTKNDESDSMDSFKYRGLKEVRESYFRLESRLFHKGRFITPSFIEAKNMLLTFQAVGLKPFLTLDEPICLRFVVEFYHSLEIKRDEEKRPYIKFKLGQFTFDLDTSQLSLIFQTPKALETFYTTNRFMFHDRVMNPLDILRIGLMQLRPQHVGFGDLSNLIGNPETELEDSVRLNSPEDKKSNIDAAQPKLMLLVNIVNAD